MDPLKTHQFLFDGGLRCTVRIYKKPNVGEPLRMETHWDGGRPTAELFVIYRDWVNSFTQELANEWRMNLGQAYQVANGIEIWGFIPGGQPRQVNQKEND